MLSLRVLLFHHRSVAEHVLYFTHTSRVAGGHVISKMWQQASRTTIYWTPCTTSTLKSESSKMIVVHFVFSINKRNSVTNAPARLCFRHLCTVVLSPTKWTPETRVHTKALTRVDGSISKIVDDAAVNLSHSIPVFALYSYTP